MPQNATAVVAVPFRGRADAGLRRLSADASAAGELYEAYGRRIYLFCLGRLRDPHEAEDATQQTFLNAFRGLQRGVAPEHEAAWLYKIAENVCLTRRRSSSRRRRVEAPEDLDALQDVVASAGLEADELFHLPEALQAMPEQQRRALLLREWRGLSYHEIAEELGLSHSAVETLLFRARRSLAAGLDDEQKRSKKGVARRLRAGGDAGSVFALIKTLLFSGGAKALIAGATVAATSVAAVTPSVRHAVEHAVAPPPPVKARATHHIAPASAARVDRSAPALAGRPLVVTHPPSHSAAAVHRWRRGRHLGSVRRAAPAVTKAVVPRGRIVATTHAHSAGRPKDAPVRSQRKTTTPHATASPSMSSHGKSHQSAPAKPATPPGRAKKSSAEPAQAAAAPDADHASNGVGNAGGSDNGKSGAAHGKASP